jgi:hypothetical protein
MMRVDQRIRDLARVIHEQHGDGAVAEALERARNWREAEDHAMATIWTQVAEECPSWSAVSLRLGGGAALRTAGKRKQDALRHRFHNLPAAQSLHGHLPGSLLGLRVVSRMPAVRQNV